MGRSSNRKWAARAARFREVSRQTSGVAKGLRYLRLFGRHRRFVRATGAR